MLSQINYLGSIVTPTAAQLEAIRFTIFSFVKGNMNISQQRVFNNVDTGGLGIPDPATFICAQQCAWVKKSRDSTYDLWRYDLRSLCNGRVERLIANNVGRQNHPIIFNIAGSWERFKSCFYQLNNNYRKMPLYNNDLLTRNGRDNRLLDNNFWRQNPPLEEEDISNLVIEDFIDHNKQPYSLATIRERTGLEINVNVYVRTVMACMHFINNMPDNRINDNTCLSLSNFMDRFRKGSRPFRRVLEKLTDESEILRSRHTVTYFKLVDLPVPVSTAVIKLNRSWTLNFLPNHMREFVYKFVTNALPTNTRVSHFANNPDRRCSFCSIASNPAPEETFLHLFFSCPTVSTWWREIAGELFLSDQNLLDDLNLRNVVFGSEEMPHILALCAKWSFLYIIWQNKLKRRIPGKYSFKLELYDLMLNCIKRSKNLHVSIVVLRDRLALWLRQGRQWNENL